jgi:CheY-like chemotaxis protein
LKSIIVTHQDQDYLQLSVKDTGVGIPDEKRDQIWLAFRQVSEGLNRGFEGTGLGLTITKRYVDRLGGKILLKSNAGKGSSFIVEIPVTVVKAEKNKALDNFGQSSSIIQRKNIENKDLLYVEDDIYAQKIVERILAQNYVIDFANNADIAQLKLKEKNYDLILIDVNLGTGLDGVQLMQVIRKIPYYKHIPIIAITAYASQSDRDEFLTKGFSHYISKPFPLKALSDLVDSIFK